MTIFLIGLALFFGVHLYITFRNRAPDRDLRLKWGEAKYKGLISVVSIVGFICLVIGFGQARPSAALYTAPAWGTHVNMALMLFALIALLASQMPAGQIKMHLKHPMLVAIKLWAVGHLLSNGELVSVLLFGSFLAYAVIDRIALKRRGDMGPVGVVANPKWDVIAVLVGLALYVAFVLKLHIWLIGVPVVAV